MVTRYLEKGTPRVLTLRFPASETIRVDDFSSNWGIPGRGGAEGLQGTPHNMRLSLFFEGGASSCRQAMLLVVHLSGIPT